MHRSRYCLNGHVISELNGLGRQHGLSQIPSVRVIISPCTAPEEHVFRHCARGLPGFLKEHQSGGVDQAIRSVNGEQSHHRQRAKHVVPDSWKRQGSSPIGSRSGSESSAVGRGGKYVEGDSHKARNQRKRRNLIEPRSCRRLNPRYGGLVRYAIRLGIVSPVIIESFSPPLPGFSPTIHYRLFPMEYRVLFLSCHQILLIV